MTLAALVLLQVAPLLPPAPSGWRTERLAFPLEFAPELDYRGFEDLAFAPGMFTPGSESYFSYVLALRLEGDVLVDERMLTRFLATYYRGLCRAVAADRKLAREADDVRAEVRRTEGGFHAKVAMFDAFTTGEPLDLALELTTHATPEATEILGLASPLDAAAPIWGELRALGAAWRAARPAPVLLNHLFVVVDEETYVALAGSDFLRGAFALSEERTTVRADGSYTGLYFYGQRTYFEFLRPGAYRGTGLALGVEDPGQLAAFAQRLLQEGVRSQGGPITRKLDESQLPWFEILGVEMPTAELTLFGMEYDPRFLERWHAGKTPQVGGIGRAAVLERYAAALGKSEVHATAPFGDVSAIELTLAGAARERLLAVARAAGWESELAGDTATCRAPGVAFRLRTPASPAAPTGITGFELALRAPFEREPLRLGSVTVRFQGQHASFELAR
jgi:hypothetical protein